LLYESVRPDGVYRLSRHLIMAAEEYRYSFPFALKLTLLTVTQSVNILTMELDKHGY